MSEAQAPETADPPSGLDERHIRRLWQRMVEIYGHRWLASYGDRDADGTWMAGLRDLSTAAIAVGLEKCVRRPDPWPPTLPEFRTLCEPTPEDFGLPSTHEAYQRAAHGNWSHPLIWHCAQAVGPHQLRTWAEDRIYPRWRKTWPRFVERLLAGERFEFPSSLDASRQLERTKWKRTEEGAQRMAELRKATEKTRGAA